MAFSLFSYFFKRVVENMAASFKDRYRRNKETLEWYDTLAMAVAVIALVFTFGVRIVKVDVIVVLCMVSHCKRLTQD